jgi:hypothetical protein
MTGQATTSRDVILLLANAEHWTCSSVALFQSWHRVRQEVMHCVPHLKCLSELRNPADCAALTKDCSKRWLANELGAVAVPVMYLI